MTKSDEASSVPSHFLAAAKILGKGILRKWRDRSAKLDLHRVARQGMSCEQEAGSPEVVDPGDLDE